MHLRLIARATVVSTAIAATTVLAPPPAQAGQIVDFPDEDNAVVSVGHDVASSGVLLAQTFTSGATASLTKVQLDLRRGTTAPAFETTVTRLDVLATDPATGAPTGPPLGFTTVSAAAVTDSNPCSIVSFTGLAVPITAGTSYALVVSTDGADADHSVRWCHSGPGTGSASNAYGPGSAWSAPTGTWQAGDPAIDRRFATFVSFENTVPVCGDVGPMSTNVNTSVVVPFSCTDQQAWQQLTYSRSTQPGHGTVSPASGPAGTLVYTPAPGYTGPDSFTYRARDGYESSGTRTVFVNVTAPVPPAPVPATVSVVGRPKLDKDKGTAKLAVSVSGGGTLAVSGKGVKKATVSPAQAGGITVTVKPTSQTRDELEEKGKATVTVTLTFAPTGSTPAPVTTTKKVKLKLKL